MSYPVLKLSKSKDAMIERKHPWIFSGAFHKNQNRLEEGTKVSVVGQEGKILATGHYQNASIMVRILDFAETLIDVSFYLGKINAARSYRADFLNIPNSETNAYRLIHGEGDGLPGLIIDIYNDTAVVQCHSIGMFKDIQLISEAIQQSFGESISCIYDKSKEHHTGSTADGVIWGKAKSESVVLENGHQFIVNWEHGQKTGFFLDQRDNRLLLGQISKNRKVLNLFAYTGGFSVYAAQSDASQVDSVDISAKAIEMLYRNMDLSPSTAKHEAHIANVLEYIKDYEDYLPYDIVIVDPPAFAKSVQKRHNAVMAYKRLNAQVFAKVKPNSIIMTFSCSQVVDAPLFYNTIMSAAIEVGRPVRVIRHLSQGGDHPVNIYHQEGHYLKGLMLLIE